MTDQELIASLSPVQVFGLTLYGEGRGGSPQLRQAIAGVIANRTAAKHDAWGLTEREVCLKHAQFSCWEPKDGKANYEAVMTAARFIAGGGRPGPVLLDCLATAANALHDALVQDLSHGGTFYYAPDAMVPRGRVPDWAVGKDPVAVVDSTHFFKLAPDGDAL